MHLDDCGVLVCMTVHSDHGSALGFMRVHFHHGRALCHKIALW